MAIAYDASSSVYNSSASTSHTLSHTCTGSNRVLVVGTRTYDANAITGVTYNGVSMTEVGSNVALGSDAFRRWILVNPASGANDIVASLSSSRRIEIYAVSFTGAKQSAQPDASATATGSSTSATGSVTTVADNSWVVAFAESNGASGAWSSSTNCTVVQSITDRGAAGYGGPKTPAGSFTQAIAIASTGGWGFAQVSIAPAPTTDYSIVAASGSYTLTGTEAALKAALRIVAAAGSYAVTGTAAALSRGYGIVAEVGSYAVTGTAAALTSARRIVAAAGSYALTGTAATLQRGYGILCAAGSYVVTGVNAVLRPFPLRWGGSSRNASSWSNDARGTSTWTNDTRN